MWARGHVAGPHILSVRDWAQHEILASLAPSDLCTVVNAEVPRRTHLAHQTAYFQTALRSYSLFASPQKRRGRGTKSANVPKARVLAPEAMPLTRSTLRVPQRLPALPSRCPRALSTRRGARSDHSPQGLAHERGPLRGCWVDSGQI